ncbi:conserved oligomeric Golgi complex subunit 6 [Diorhabda carinulata]|uniref:conserved oligomeric Golgi complex subunit 6 n=1 Tax=Diorhabda carinulata TaxID=1163345 RepID=UPI0025A1C935|nr:conserved oligomeric Golgi complex subunit 6 [Diorhabda carinulata]XP_057652793.1 conserved oligomeric Golgi complex subunit 6 [Diorhabda carinulata]
MDGVNDTGKEHILSKRLNKIIQARIENDEETINAFKQLSMFYTENSLKARRNLRSQIEKRSLDINKQFLASFLEVKNAFDCIYNDIADMSKSIQDMEYRLQNTKSRTKQLLQQTSTLQNERAQSISQQKIVDAFLGSFQLSPEHVKILQSNKELLLTPEIFTVLDRVQEIHNNCKMLMQSGLQTLALDIMEQMTLYQESGLERLYRWTQSHCRNVENPELTDLITQAMSRLQDRQVLFRYVLDEYCVCRRSKITDGFINALTRGGPSGNPAPIEMRAHDSQIYVTDMLVWLNKAIATEKQNLILLLKLCTKINAEEIISDSLAVICEGVCQPLKMRVDKILNVPSPASVLYSVVNLLRYYKKCICKIVNKGAIFETLTELQENSEKCFLTSLQKQVDSKLVRVEAPPRDLSPTEAITNLLALLRDILSTANMSEGREMDMIKITQTVMDPLLSAVNEQASRLPPTDMAVYMLNCMYEMYTCLSLYEFMDKRLERLEAQSEAQIDTLFSKQVGYLVANLTLGPIYTILQDQTHGALSEVPGMEPTNLKNLLKKIDDLGVHPDKALLPQVHLLTSSKHKKLVQKRSFDLLLSTYKQLYQAVMNPINKYENPGSIFNKTPEELEKILLK